MSDLIVDFVSIGGEEAEVIWLNFKGVDYCLPALTDEERKKLKQEITAWLGPAVEHDEHSQLLIELI